MKLTCLGSHFPPMANWFSAVVASQTIIVDCALDEILFGGGGHVIPVPMDILNGVLLLVLAELPHA